jgi:hypothetical protein
MGIRAANVIYHPLTPLIGGLLALPSLDSESVRKRPDLAGCQALWLRTPQPAGHKMLSSGV